MDGTPDGTAPVQWVLSNLAVVGHEFGHAVHAGFAPNSFQQDYTFAAMVTDANGKSWSMGHGPNQYEEMGTGITEGLASTIGNYLVNGCNGFISRYRPLGGSDPFSANMWNGDKSCDANKSGDCSYWHVRWHLNARGLTEGGDEWNARVSRLAVLNAQAVSLGQRWIISNNEGRISEFGCDLLDTDSDVSQAQSIANGLSYADDFTYGVGRILDGFDDPLVTKTWTTAPRPEKVQLSLPQFLEAMQAFCPSCPAIVGSAQWGSSYDRDRLSVHTGMHSMQHMGAYMVSRGWLTLDELSNLLRSNYMED
jgi:hypothetical protein